MALTSMKKTMEGPVGEAVVKQARSHITEILGNVYGHVEGDVSPHPKIYCDRGRHLHADALGLTSYVSMYYYMKSKGRAFTYMRKGERLVHDVHNVLGRHRVAGKGNTVPDHLGFSDEEQPLLGGLRSGNAMGESRPQGDGQQWYPICLWAFALNRLAVATENPRYNELAAQLLIVAGRKFIQQTIADPDNVEGGQSIYTLPPRMSIDLEMALPSVERPTNSLVGALVCGIVKNGFGPDGDSKILKSLDLMEKRLVSIWEQNIDNEMIHQNPLLIGDMLWAGHWSQHTTWGKKSLQVGRERLSKILSQPTPLHELPLNIRYVPGELWMIAASRGQDILSSKQHEKLEQLFESNKIRISMWGLMGQAYFLPSIWGGVFNPTWTSDCEGFAKSIRNAGFYIPTSERSMFE
eukprot:TRINITY_DN37214_c0_g1_i1.p1 TRINITY_DN37214_c0_g1~~TRINITY_DN37214_c0_g1_i1.p1  ORF type:complete len:422 (+),score=60.23 TRINITY_DN37214_c0_g1_i1:43-1266(+)